VITRTWTVADCAGNHLDLPQTINVTDIDAPTYTVPPAITIYTDANCNYNVDTTFTGTPTNLHDNCTPVQDLRTSYIDAPAVPATYPGLYTITRTWSVIDCMDNTREETQTITIRDSIPPVIVCKTTQTRCATQLLPLHTYITIGNEFDATATDNCLIINHFTYSLSGVTNVGTTNANTLAGVAFNVGTTTVSWTVYDASGNSSTCNFNVLINPLPRPVISGPDSVCCAITKSYCDVSVAEYLMNGDPNPLYDAGTFSYQWTISGGTIQWGASSSCVEVKWDCNCTNGWLQLTKTNLVTGCVTTTDHYNVVIMPTPVPVINGSLVVNTLATGVLYYVTPSIPGHLYNWTVTGGTITWGQGNDSILVDWDWAACQQCPSSVCVTETAQPFGFNNPLGPTACDGQACITITQIGATKISGVVSYDQYTFGVNTPVPLNGAIVDLMQGNVVVASTTSYSNIDETDPLNPVEIPGYYEFDGVMNGSYTLRVAATNKPWLFNGNVTATDALLIKLSIGNSGFFNALQTLAANVNIASGVNATDALLVQLRIVGRVNSFAAGDWVSTPTSATAIGANIPNKDISVLATGDVNRSYPIQTGYKAVAYTNLQKDGITMTNTGQEFELPIRVNDVLSLGAVTLDLSYNRNLIDVIGLTSPLSGFEYNIINGKVMIAWSNTSAVSLQANDILFTLKVKAKEELTASADLFSYGNNTEFADENGRILSFSTLKVNSIATDAKNYGINVYPNPFKNNVEFDYNLVEEGSVKLYLYNALGQRMDVLVDEYKTAGNYKFNLNTSELQSGVYSCEIIINGKTSNFQKVIKLVKTK
jgi:hypothetical protein